MLIIEYYIIKLYIINGFNAFNISVTVRSICMLSVNIGRSKINRDLGMINETYLYMMFGNNLLIQIDLLINLLELSSKHTELDHLSEGSDL